MTNKRLVGTHMDTRDYKSEKCEVHFLSELLEDDAEKLIGKTVSRVDAYESSLTLTFTDGSSITCSGYQFDGAMGVRFEDVKGEKP